MQVRYSADPVRFQRMTTEEIRSEFLIESLFESDKIDFVYSDIDRAVIGSAVPVEKSLTLASADELRAQYFCQRRELGILNVGSAGKITVDGQAFDMANRDALYVGMGSKEITFESADKSSPACFYLLSYPAHKTYPTAQARKADAAAVNLGSEEQCNKRTIYKYIHPDGVKSCQLVMGFTEIADGSVWNTMPPHTHARRMEAYLYFDIPEDARVFHFMGKPEETRTITVADKQAIISPSWSIHSGVGTKAYTFCWGMGGENQAFDDMDHITIDQVK
ncbi:4-deoxy-L-threo-5-hexosulose-uronate ketol-isomerase [Anaerohalosphaera lusitana]|uniref:4-deoxy-L-threo-5-hexosulose-uronate ketol-isomerase n=1 Tax=Anaerohalosphaera lusitana TaxID=1936003 RepID=A0A1U9NQH9_9BACT|nr:5-dehydro-4-deoxy-D-glucuronate isomerase [Anaerohalosphaera lusitana]AQT69994.1 4-deoxy-L-threo-5-hexosulose-uronate ketol-isomerase [Anaerohalosphaera lusitana]